MKVVAQRVSHAAVRVDNELIAQIGEGLLLLVGFTHSDSEANNLWMTSKLANMRIFEDSKNKMNLSLLEKGGSVLVVSQFTLYADSRKGRRPAFVDAAEPGHAEGLFGQFCELLADEGLKVEKGLFGAKMDVELVNDGPVTIILER